MIKLYPLLFETMLSKNEAFAQAQTTIVQSVVSELETMGIILNPTEPPENADEYWKPNWRLERPIQLVARSKHGVVKNIDDEAKLILYVTSPIENDGMGHVAVFCWIGRPFKSVFRAKVNEELEAKYSKYVELRETQLNQLDLDQIINDLVSTAKNVYDNLINKSTLFYDVNTRELTAE